jgi:hypothetical protein
MILPSRTLWDTRIQCLCSVVAASEGDDTELWVCANYGQVSFDAPRIIVNPNRLYPIGPASYGSSAYAAARRARPSWWAGEWSAENWICRSFRGRCRPCSAK